MEIKEMIVDGKVIYLKKSFTGYRIVYPIKIDGKINLKHLIAGGSWFNLIKLAGIIAIILVFTSEYASVVKVAQECLSDSFIPSPIW